MSHTHARARADTQNESEMNFDINEIKIITIIGQWFKFDAWKCKTKAFSKISRSRHISSPVDALIYSFFLFFQRAVVCWRFISISCGVHFCNGSGIAFGISVVVVIDWHWSDGKTTPAPSTSRVFNFFRWLWQLWWCCRWWWCHCVRCILHHLKISNDQDYQDFIEFVFRWKHIAHFFGQWFQAVCNFFGFFLDEPHQIIH